MTVLWALDVWEHYKPCLLSNAASVAYMRSSNPTNIDYSKDIANKDPFNHIELKQFIGRVILQFCDSSITLARLVDK
jgi:hypothetical protein